MNYYPPIGFYFRVEFNGIDGAGPKSVDTNFQEVSGLTQELEVEKLQEGGVNDFQHPLPKPVKYPNLVLKRGMLPDSKLVDWLTKALDAFEIEPKTINVALLNPKGEPLMSWEFIGAWPLKWETSGFNATDNALVVESIELTYQKFRRIKPNGN